jgi:TetR/AcrR family transcriptional regulator
LSSPSHPDAAPALAADDRRRTAHRGKARVDLLAVARTEFAAKGFAGTRVDEIAQVAGVNKQAIYHHFGNKDGLFLATLEAGYAQVLRTNLAYMEGRKPAQPARALRHLVAHIFDRFHLHPQMVELVIEENRQKGRHITRKDLVAQANGPLIDYLAQILKRGEQDGSFIKGNNPKQVFFDVISLCMFYFANVHTMSAALGEDFGSPAAARARKAHIVRQLLRALRPD